MPQIIPIRDLKDTTKISDMCNNSSEPIFVTKNGYGDMVIMSISTYDEYLARLEMHDKILEGKNQADKGETIPEEESFCVFRRALSDDRKI